MGRFSLKFAAWPESDRSLWLHITAAGCPLDNDGVGSHWAPETKRVIARDYGYWLSFISATNPAALHENPIARVTPDRVRLYLQSMLDVSPLTQTSRIARLHHVIRCADTENDLGWLCKMRRALEKLARRQVPVRNKRPRIVSTGRIIDAGISLMQRTHSGSNRRIYLRAKDFRDGLMIALLAARPLRLKNFAALRLGSHIRPTSDGYLIDIPGVETKTGRPIETFVPDELCPWFSLYLRDYRPYLLGGRQLDFLWVHSNGNPYQPGALSQRISKLTARNLGVAINPHLFRDCAATTVATDDPDHVLIIANILGHTTLRTAEDHYNHALCIDANRRVRSCIEHARKQVPAHYKKI